jgi:hypothetical protein
MSTRKNKILAAAVALAFSAPIGALAQNPADLDEIRKQIQDLKDAYESRMQALEKRLKSAEDAATSAQEKAKQAEAKSEAAQQAQAPAPGRQASINAFNPAISLILSGTYGNFKNDPTQYAITGFQPPGATSPGDRGFQLGESELFITANVDHLFMGALNLAIEGEGVAAEEAYFQTLALGHGLTLKGGRFFSAIGYQNSIHAHAWDFVDPSLVQRAFLGGNYGDDGVQVSWIAPLPLLVEVGGELGRGRGLVGSFDTAAPGELLSNDRNKNGIGAASVFLHVGGDIGDSNAYRIGVSHLRTSTSTNSFPLADFDNPDTGVLNTFTNAQTRLYGVDLVWKWAPSGNYQYQNFKFVAEWFQLHRSGDLTFDVNGVNGAPTTDAFTQRQSGWYVQGAYQFHPYWRVGLRYDQLQPGTLDAGLNAVNLVASDYKPKRYSAMIDWNPSEFSRIRVQYNEDKSTQNLTDHQIFLQYIYSLGTHGAHKF